MLRSARPAHRAGAARSPAVPRASAPRTISLRPVAASAAPRRNYAASFVPISSKVPVTLAEGDGIGPEISTAVVHILKEAGAAVEFQKVEVGEKEYRRGHLSGIAGETWDTIRRNKVMLKGPITTPSGGGYKSLNVTMRKTLGLYANVRPCQSMHPFVATKHPTMDVVIVRENEEDLYAGIEHTQTNEVVQCLKLISRPGCEKICQYAFEYARRNGRKKVSCFVKDNIMKMTDGLFAKVFEETGAKYPEIQRDRWIVDIGAARLADTPEIFDVIVMPNLYGDILSDVAAQITGSVGLGGSVNLGDHGAIFEAIHGSAPMIAGKDVANPSGLLLSSVMLLNHIGQSKTAENVHNAWLRTMEEGVHTPDLFKPPHSRKQVGTQEFGRQVAARLGKKPEKLKAVNYSDTDTSMREWKPHLTTTHNSVKEIVGVDVFLHWNPRSGIQYQSAPDYLAGQISTVSGDGLDLLLVTNRGVKVWPGGFPETFCTDHWRLRFKAKNGKTVQHNQIISLLMRITNLGFDFIKMENLYTFDGAAGYSLAQGE